MKKPKRTETGVKISTFEFRTMKVKTTKIIM